MGEEICADIEGNAFRDEIQNFRLKDVDAGVDHVAGGFFHRGLLLEGFHPPVVIGDNDAVAADLVAGNALGDQARHGPLGLVAFDGFAEIEIDQRIAAKHDEGVIEEVLEGLDFLESASGSNGVTNQLAVFNSAFKAVGNFNAKALTIPEVVLDLLSKVGDIHHHFGESVLPEKFQQKLHHGFLKDGDHRLRDRVSDRSHTGSLACSQDHRLHRATLRKRLRPQGVREPAPELTLALTRVRRAAEVAQIPAHQADA